MENQIEQLRAKDAGNNVSHDDALINKLALEMVNSQGSTAHALETSGEKAAPESATARYGIATIDGLKKVPLGIINAAEADFHDPLGTLGKVGMGAGMAVALKAVLPEGGPAGALAGLAVGAYFTYRAAEPIMDGYKKAGAATTMNQLDAASTQIGNAGGAFVVDSAIAGVGAKFGTMAADRALSLPQLAGFTETKNNLYNGAFDKLNKTFSLNGDQALADAYAPHNFGVIPDYMLEEMARRNPDNLSFLNTRNKGAELSKQGDQFKPNANGEDFHGAREVYDAGGQEVQPGDKVRFEGEKPSGNVEADQAYDYTGQVRDFYQKVFGRDSIDGHGMKMVSTVNYGDNFQNAFWNGEQMTYGRPSADSPFKTFMMRDITGHEITHGVTEMEAGTQYHGQSGALNESYSDVFGAVIDQYAKGQTADKGSWLIGEGIWKDNINGRALRDMVNPGTAYNDPAIGKDMQPTDMTHYIKTTKDNGGVHINSSIPNKAFADFAKSVGGNAWEDPAHIWFDARKAAGSTPSFGSFAFQTLEAAKAMGNADNVAKLESAWKGVGVVPDANGLDVLTPSKRIESTPSFAWLRNIFGSTKKAA